MPANLWDLTVLCLLREREMHPYEMQRLIKLRHKNDFLQLKRGSLYHAVGRALRDHFIEEVGAERTGNRPDRTIYRLTACGETRLHEWLGELLSQPAREPSSFVAALSFLGHLPPDEARDHLELRIQQLQCKLVAMSAIIKELQPRIGRLPLIEAEYMKSSLEAELQWVRSVVAELRSGNLDWDPQQLLASGGCCPTDSVSGDASASRANRPTT